MNKAVKFFSIILLFIIVITNNCFGQQDYNVYVDNMNLISKSAVFVMTPKGTGTGVFMLTPLDTNIAGGVPTILTAKHVVAKDYDSVGMPKHYFDSVLVFIKRKDGNIESQICKVIIKDSLLDVAALFPFNMTKEDEQKYDIFNIGNNHIANLSEIQSGRTTFLAGYPFGIGSQELHPVLQSGIVSYSDLKNHITLVDIPVNYGNSGCPVFIVNSLMQIKLLGIVFAYQTNQMDYVINISNRSLSPSNSALGKVVLIKPFISKISEYYNNYIKHH